MVCRAPRRLLLHAVNQQSTGWPDALHEEAATWSGIEITVGDASSAAGNKQTKLNE